MDYTNYGKRRIKEIEAGKASGVDVRIYDDIKFDGKQMYQIRKGLEAGIDAAMYADEAFTNLQMEEIRLGLEAGIDAVVYANPELTADKMRQVRESMEFIAYPKETEYDFVAMDCIRQAIYFKLPVEELLHPEYTSSEVFNKFNELMYDEDEARKEEFIRNECDEEELENVCDTIKIEPVKKKRGIFKFFKK